METTVYAVGNQSTREVAGWLVGFPYCVSELSDTENQNELMGWPVQATLISELGIPVVKCRQGHPHAEGDGKTVGHLERQLAFSIGFRKKRESDSVTSWTRVGVDVMGLGVPCLLSWVQPMGEMKV